MTCSAQRQPLKAAVFVYEPVWADATIVGVFNLFHGVLPGEPYNGAFAFMSRL